FFFFFNDTATTEIYTLSLHDALPISCHFPIRRAVRCVRCALGWTKRELRLDRGLDPERLTRAPRLPYKGSRGPHEEERAKIGRQEIRCQEDSSGKSSDLARAVGANRLARHPGAQSEGRRLQRRRGSRTGRDSRLLMALSLASGSLLGTPWLLSGSRP